MTTSSDSESSSPVWQVAVQYAVLSDVGMRRASNQDSYAVMLAESESAWHRFGHLFVVADGMGAHAAGELASKMAVELIPHRYRKQTGPLPAENLQRSLQEANAEIFRRGQANAEFRSMGTTGSALVLLPEGAVAAQVGDSRVYFQRGDRLQQLTFDHSLVWEMQASGEISEATVRSGAIPKNVITRSLGPNATVMVDLEGPFPFDVGDRFLLCSDGLSGQIPDEEMGAIMAVLPPKEACQALVDLANLRGGPDNVTVIIVEITGSEIATNGGKIRRSGDETAQFSTALTVVSIVCFLASSIFLLISNAPLAIVAGILGVVALITGTIQWYSRRHGDPYTGDRYGRGPHREFNCRPDGELVDRLKGVLDALRQASKERSWQIDWQPIDESLATSSTAAARGDFFTAAGTLASAISTTMRQLRQKNPKSSSDSSIDL